MGESVPLGLLLFAIFVLIGINGFLAAAQYAMEKARADKIEALAQKGGLRARMAKRAAGRIEHYATVCRLGITAASIGLGWIGACLAVRQLAPWLLALGMRSASLSAALSCVLVYAGIVLLQLLFGELAPRSIASRKAESTVLLAAAPLSLLYMALSPLVRLLLGATGRLLQWCGMESSAKPAAHTEEDLRSLIKESRRNGLIDGPELALVDNIFDFTGTTAREIMIPRTEMICLKAGLSLQANKTIAIQYMRTRYPVCENDKDNIIGFVHIKDLLKETAQPADNIKNWTRPVITVPESIPISALLKLMQKSKCQIAILIDEYGGTSGLVTLEDIMEEIVGDIRDEFDDDPSDIVKREDGSYSISGLMLIEEVNGFFGLSISTDDYETIGGWLYSQVDSPPVARQAVIVQEKYVLEIEETRHLRIARIALRRIRGDTGDGAERRDASAERRTATNDFGL